MKKSNRIRFDHEKLNNTHICNEYKELIIYKNINELEDTLKNINIDELSTDNAYIQISKSITDTAQNILGKYRLRKQPWITDEILELCDKRRSLKATKHKNSKHAEEYRIVHNLIRRSMKDT